MKVIITRPSPDAEDFAAEIAGAGVTAIISPVMAIRPRAGEIDLAGVGALAFTSSNGVRVFAGLSGERNLKTFAVGAATVAAARREGFSDIASAAGDVESLADLITISKPYMPVLYLAGSERAGDLVGLLAERGLAARRAVIYDAVEIAAPSPIAAAALAENPADCVVVFFSPRSARLFIRQARAAGAEKSLSAAVALCMSAEIGAAADEIAWARIEISQHRAAEAMARLVEAEKSARNRRTGKSR
ncbi:MAG: uroporphyrinogen-III synthase [Parvularculaceae bacterium]|nr:uroporphyrinogen-III synthase [Parvularculaceae bacterium]